MANSLRKFISAELKLYRNINGILLKNPDNRSQHPLDTGFTVKSVMNLPCNVYFLDQESINVKINEEVARTVGYASPQAGIGKSVFDDPNLLPCTADTVRQQDIKILQKLKNGFYDEDIFQKDGTFKYVTLKFPIFNDKNEALGVFGFGIRIDIQPIIQTLQTIAKMGLLADNHETKQNMHPFSSRETSIIKHIIRGKTAKEIAKQIFLSSRTVEHYIENIKNKIGANSRSELIDMTIDQFK